MMTEASAISPLIDANAALPYSHKQRDVICITASVLLHALVFLWNPNIMKSELQKVQNPLVEIGVVDEMAAAPAPAAPKKMTLLDTLKDMLTKPEPPTPQINAPQAPTAPPPPLLRERMAPHPITNVLHNQANDDLAMSKTPNQIATQEHNFQLPNAAPSLQAKTFSGIKMKDLPFETSNDNIATPGQAVPIAVGHTSAKASLGYVSPTLQQNNRTTLSNKRFTGTASEPVGVGAAPTPILTGASQAAPTYAAPALSNRQTGGSINNLLVGKSQSSLPLRAPTAPSQIDQQQIATDTGASHVKKVKNGFDIEGKLANRTILKKVIPQYPSWAEEQGIIGTLRLYFTVTPEGTVRPNIKVTKTTGNPQLDQVGIDALKQWQFAPQSGASDDDVQWGIITFTFSLAS